MDRCLPLFHHAVGFDASLWDCYILKKLPGSKAMKGIFRTVVIGTLCLGAASWVQAQWPLGKELPQVSAKSEPGPNITVTGRFQIFISPHTKGHTFMLDTDTGKIWVLHKDPTAGDFSLKRVPVEEVDGKSGEKPPGGETRGGEKKTSDKK